MKLKNNYIFLSRDEELLGGSPLNNLLGIIDEGSILSVFKKNYNLKNKMNLEQLKDFDATSLDELNRIMDKLEFLANINNVSIDFNLYIKKVLSLSYCTIEIEGSKTKKICEKLELLHNQIISNQELNQNYIIICSYDSVSEYYCNKIYSKLNHAERLLRKLMLNIYTVNLKDEYYEKTIPKEIGENIKKRVGRPKEKIRDLSNKDGLKEFRIQESFNNITYEEIKGILFTKTWNSFDEECIEKFLNTNKELPKLSDDVLRNKFKEIKPKNDWERFFNNINVDIDFEELLENIRSDRNKVAHSKTFNSINYKKLNNNLDELIKLVEKAIDITETVEFNKKNREYLNEIGNNIKNAVLLFSEMISECVKEVKKNFVEKINRGN